MGLRDLMESPPLANFRSSNSTAEFQINIPSFTEWILEHSTVECGGEANANVEESAHNGVKVQKAHGWCTPKGPPFICSARLWTLVARDSNCGQRACLLRATIREKKHKCT